MVKVAGQSVSGAWEALRQTGNGLCEVCRRPAITVEALSASCPGTDRLS